MRRRSMEYTAHESLAHTMTMCRIALSLAKAYGVDKGQHLLLTSPVLIVTLYHHVPLDKAVK